MTTLLALDTGGDTGYASAEVDLNRKGKLSSFKHVSFGLTKHGELPTCGCGRVDCASCDLGMEALLSLVRRITPDVLIIEDFILSPKTKSDLKVLAPVRINQALITMMKFGGLRKPKVVDKTQTASQAKGKATDERLRRTNLWIPGQKHARDAVRHLVLYVDRNL